MAFEMLDCLTSDRRYLTPKQMAARAVGGAMHANRTPIVVPCHRVIGSSGALVGFAGGLDKKQILLSLEQSQIP